MRVKEEMSQNATEITVLLDSGAMANLIHPEVVESNEWMTTKIRGIQIRNINDSPTGSGSIQEKVRLELRIGNHQEVIEAYVAPIGQDRMVLGTPWMKQHNPSID